MAQARGRSSRGGGRAARVQARTNPPPVYLPTLNRKVGPIDLLGPEGVERIHNAAMTILETTGIEFRDPVALADWKKYGADVQGERVRIGRDMLMDLISSVPSEWAYAARNPERSLRVGNEHSVFANAYGAPFVYDLDGVRRPSQLEDAQNFFKMSQMSQSMMVPGILPVEPQDVPVPQRHLELVHAALTLTDKPIKGSVLSEQAARDSVDMTRIVFGEEFVDNNVVMAALLNCNTPLVWDETMLESLRVYAAANQPCLLSPFVLAGASTPASPQGGVALLIAESLAGMAYSQIIRRGAPMVLGVAIMGVSMKTGAPMMGSPEPGLMNLLVGQMARFYQVPWRTCTMWTGSKSPDMQAGFDTANTMWPVLLGGANYIVHSAGFLEGALGVSYSKWVQDTLQLENFHRFFSGLQDEDLDPLLDDIARIGPGGHFLGTDHTRENPMHMNHLQNNDSFEQWEAEGSKTAEVVGNEAARRMLDNYVQPPMPDDQRGALDEFVAKKRREYSS
ncbi:MULTISPECIES: trimethylamine methyltransferase family protein [unclassified Ruegeria]|uniref:trimethylamine methyltransferase family protein n=1 Tax=unclassified Ruegeria TaxID=2625375 RepID=UPI0014899987|nr:MULTISPECIES: trimethylamine methyltransferase family protein [unclassified Ruegeria]NOD77694.1 trimethylamine methyltransferase [Ruegeria sp. HKCCD4332]NOD89902.1 trimethylamine methyltransferase [Ruegeria sp. HKCCD4318]NOE14652.1 trimethylamine methyltransferase [Ruegeria sp. HKCCD4318-2]NOG10994.1 trimethylamine methyltransferase family protein [Ruegeria sp. HKCCD4315]